MTTLGCLRDFTDRAATPLTIQVDGKPLAILVVRHGDEVRAWLDLCPHRALPLTLQGTRVLSADGLRLRCSIHAAEFCAKEGHALAGGASGLELTAVPLRIGRDGVLRLNMRSSQPWRWSCLMPWRRGR